MALRQKLDLYACVRPVRYFDGVPSPVKQPELVDMIIFRENSEDIYAGIEFQDGEADTERFKTLFREAFPDLYAKIRFPNSTGIGIKPVSQEGTTGWYALPSTMPWPSGPRASRSSTRATS